MVATLGALGALVLACGADEPEPGPGQGLPGSRASTACTPGDHIFAIDAYNLTPSNSAGSVCGLANILDEDGKEANLASGAAPGLLLDREVNGCAAVEFSEGVTISSLIMKMRPTGSACGQSCSGEGCGTGWKVGIFVGPSLDQLDYLQQLSLTQTETFEYRVAVYGARLARFAVVCREATPNTGDNIAIDALSGLCAQPPQPSQ